MNFTLIVCTYQRPDTLLKLLKSVEKQSVCPDEIIIVDGSPDSGTERVLKEQQFKNLSYFRVEEKDRGLTRQRNYGINRVQASAKVVCFLDDDIVLTEDYFKNLLQTYNDFPDAIGVGGYILDEVKWENTEGSFTGFDEFEFDGWKRKLGSRNVLRKKLNLLSEVPPGYMPEEGNGFSTGFLPPTGKTYPVEFFMGGVASYRKEIFNKIGFSEYFEGYGLYEDMDFCLRASGLGQLYVNTAAQLYHYHEESGRPNKFRYGKMVVRNGWYVWRIKYPNPRRKARLKWHSTALLLTLIRFGNSISGNAKKEAFTESLGRLTGWWSLLWDRPKVTKK